MTRTLFLLVLTFVPTTLLASTTHQEGGTGGSPFEILCPPGRVLVGIEGRSGSRVDQVRGVCRFVNDDYTWTSAAPVRTAARGGGGGNPNDSLCATNTVVVGIFGRAGNRVDRLGVFCGRPGERSSRADSMGGRGGNPFSATLCATTMTGVGLRGRSGSEIDAIALVCAEAGSNVAANRYFSARFDLAQPPQVCRPGDFVSEVQCFGGFCKEMRIRCRNDSGYTTGRHTWVLAKSSSSHSERQARCPDGFYIAGMACSGPFCSHSSAYCVEITNGVRQNDCRVTDYFSSSHMFTGFGGKLATYVQCQNGSPFCQSKRFRMCSVETSD